MYYIFSNPDWGYLMTISGIILGVLSIILTIKYPFNKELLLTHWTNETIYHSNDNVRKPIHELMLAFQCQSKVPIVRGDLANLITIELEDNSIITSSSIRSNNKHNIIIQNVTENKIEFEFTYIEPKDFIQFVILYEADQKTGGKIHGKVIGGNEIVYKIEPSHSWDEYDLGKRKANANFKWLPVTTVLSFVGFISIFVNFFKIRGSSLINLILRFDKQSTIIVLILILLFLISIRIGYFFRSLVMPFSDAIKKVKEWHFKSEYFCKKNDQSVG
jgi:hypothetical protein